MTLLFWFLILNPFQVDSWMDQVSPTGRIHFGHHRANSTIRIRRGRIRIFASFSCHRFELGTSDSVSTRGRIQPFHACARAFRIPKKKKHGFGCKRSRPSPNWISSFERGSKERERELASHTVRTNRSVFPTRYPPLSFLPTLYLGWVWGGSVLSDGRMGRAMQGKAI